MEYIVVYMCMSRTTELSHTKLYTWRLLIVYRPPPKYFNTPLLLNYKFQLKLLMHSQALQLMHCLIIRVWFHLECYTGRGTDYSGTLDKTVGGLTCQRWDSQVPHSHGYSGEENYCRNPSAHNRPWCYTTDRSVRWQNCDIQICEFAGRNPQRKFLHNHGALTGRLFRMWSAV